MRRQGACRLGLPRILPKNKIHCRPWRQCTPGLAEHQAFAQADGNAREGTSCIRAAASRRAEDLGIEAGDARSGSCGGVDLEIGHAQAHRTKTRGVRRMHADAVAPGTGDVDQWNQLLMNASRCCQPLKYLLLYASLAYNQVCLQ